MSEKRQYISKQTRELVYNKYNGHCAYCGCELDYKDMQVDHFAPVHVFGDNTRIDNLMPSCRMCNFYKNSLTISKFRQELSKLTSRLENQFIYRLAKKYKMITEEEIKDIKFYFETVDVNKVKE